MTEQENDSSLFTLDEFFNSDEEETTTTTLPPVESQEPVPEIANEVVEEEEKNTEVEDIIDPDSEIDD